jgi:hypothetical protein
VDKPKQLALMQLRDVLGLSHGGWASGLAVYGTRQCNGIIRQSCEPGWCIACVFRGGNTGQSRLSMAQLAVGEYANSHIPEYSFVTSCACTIGACNTNTCENSVKQTW